MESLSSQNMPTGETLREDGGPHRYPPERKGQRGPEKKKWEMRRMRERKWVRTRAPQSKSRQTKNKGTLEGPRAGDTEEQCPRLGRVCGPFLGKSIRSQPSPSRGGQLLRRLSACVCPQGP